MKLTLPFPPSVNTYYRAPNKGSLKGKLLISERGRKYRKAVYSSVLWAYGGLPRAINIDVEVKIILYPPDN